MTIPLEFNQKPVRVAMSATSKTIPFARKVIALAGAALLLQTVSQAQLNEITVSRSPSLAIPDLAFIQDQITVNAPAGKLIETVDLTYNFSHQWPADLSIDLQSQEGGFEGSFDLRPPPAPSGQGFSPRQFQGYVRTFEGLTGFQGESASQTFTLSAVDQAGIDSGILNSWSITIHYLQTPTISQVILSSNIAQTALIPTAITIIGANFTFLSHNNPGNARVTITGPGAPWDFPVPPNITQTGNTVSITAFFGNNPGNFAVTITNPSGANVSAPFTLVAPGPPDVVSMAPDSFQATGTPHTVDVRGSSFIDSQQQRLQVSLQGPGGANIIIPQGQIIGSGGGLVRFSHAFVPGDEGDWTLTLTTAFGSDSIAFTVVGEVQPTLEIVREGDMVKVSWPSELIGWILHRTANPAGGWAPVLGTPPIEGGKYVRRYPIDMPEPPLKGVFLYRLQRQ